MKTRRRARRVALETLYEFDIANHVPEEILEQRILANPMETVGVEFAAHLLHGVIRYQEEIDTLIARYAPEWPLDQMAVIDRNILRIAIFEFLIDGQVSNASSTILFSGIDFEPPRAGIIPQISFSYFFIIIQNVEYAFNCMGFCESPCVNC